MTHKMKLRSQPFNMIRSGQKTFELRLYDEKRQLVQVNDEIEFSCLDGNEAPFVVRVIALHLFKNFGELYATLPLLECGYTKETIDTASPEDMNQYYSVEEQARYGVVGIEIKLKQSDDPMLRASRFLSLVLRHKPEAAGISLDEHGWANVKNLLRGIANRHPLTMEQLERIVRTDDKQRYSFNDDKTKIRANQGHSIPVDVELAECNPPEFLYHGTGEKYRNSILGNGLVPKTRLYVHLSKDIETAETVGIRHGAPVVFIVQSGQMAKDGFRFYCSENGVWLTKHVPPKYLKDIGR